MATMSRCLLLAVALLVGKTVDAEVKELSEKTWNDSTQGRNSFVMFQAPW